MIYKSLLEVGVVPHMVVLRVHSWYSAWYNFWWFLGVHVVLGIKQRTPYKS